MAIPLDERAVPTPKVQATGTVHHTEITGGEIVVATSQPAATRQAL